MPSFVDTNILIYAEDRDARTKHEVARDLVLKLWEDRDGVVSVQVLQEFYVNATRKLKRPLSNTKALEIVEEYLTWTVIENTGDAHVSDSIANQSEALLLGCDDLAGVCAAESNGHRAPKRIRARSRAFSASSSRLFGDAVVWSESMSTRAAFATSFTACSKAASLALEGLVKPLSLRTN